MSVALDRRDIQGLLVGGYRSLRAAAFQVLEVTDAGRARGWLASIAEAVATGGRRPGRGALNVAISASGLARLGVRAEVLAGLSIEFREGMAEPSRARALGDVRDSAPANWAWGGGHGRPAADLLLLRYARDAGTLHELREEHGAPAGLRLIADLDTVDLADREHFGFRDGISQPLVEGLSKRGPSSRTVRTGEFVLGHPNEYGQVPDVPDLARNGTYLVIRQLEQDVEGFWRFCREACGEGPDEAGSVELAARMVGRWPDGAALVLSPDRDDPALAIANDFGYAAVDPQGHRCPLGAHVRRANPRDALGSDAPSRSIATVRRHRILRRGRPYGEPGSERGLHFICLNASLSRQFEFVQRSWICNPHFNGLYDDADPLVAPHRPSGGTFTVQASPLRRRYTGLPRFVTVRGGAYFLLPGITALRRVARGDV